MRIKSVFIENLGPISHLKCASLGKINLIIGPNQSGKTYFLKALYSSLKTVEQFKRGKENRSVMEILSDKMYWTFQAESLGSVVKKGQSSVYYKMESSGGEAFSYSFGPSTTKKILVEENSFSPTDSNTVFIPAKEILSIKDIILDARERAEFGFEEPYPDLVKSLKRTSKGRNYKSFSIARQSISEMVGGRLEFDEDRKGWIFRDKNRRIFEIAATSEGVKKLSIMDILLGNHYLDSRAVIIIDEIEANLHPSMITRFLRTVKDLADSGIQFFISSHSYFVIKRLYIMAHESNMSIPVLSFENGECAVNDLRKEMPKNSIIDESIAMYKDEISL